MDKKHILNNGICIVSEDIPSFYSITVGIWIKNGSRYEDKYTNGISHFIEHMTFKGTKRRTARQIAEEMDSIGGQLDAFTGREYTCFYAKIMDKHLPTALDILSDILLNSSFETSEIEKEKNVVLEEIKMYVDSPDEFVHDLCAQALWGEHSLGMPILGTKENVLDISREKIKNFFDIQYGPKNILVSLAGNLQHDNVIKLIDEYFGKHLSDVIPLTINTPDAKVNKKIVTKDLEQVHICLGTKGVSFADDSRHILSILNTILGGSMSSRLFQEVREKRGLAYSIGSYYDSYVDTGTIVIYAATSVEKVNELLKIIVQEIMNLREEFVSDNELKRAKEQLKGNFILAMESTSNRMIKLAKQESYFGKTFTVDEILSEVDKVKKEDIKKLANDLFKLESFSLAAVGPIDAQNISILA